MDNSIKECIIFIISHTSNLDFFIALLVQGIINVDLNFVGKKELFAFAFSYNFRSVGFAPLAPSGGKKSTCSNRYDRF